MDNKVVIEELAYDKIMHWVDKADFEVSGLGIVEVRGGVPHVVDAILIEQEGTATSTDLDPVGVGKAEYEHHLALRAGEIEGDLKFWWHSHVNMGVFWSGTDKATIKELGEHGWFVSTVFNKKRETRTAIYQGHPFNIFADDIKLEISKPSRDEAFFRVLNEDFDSKVRKKTYVYQSQREKDTQWDNQTQSWVARNWKEQLEAFRKEEDEGKQPATVTSLVPNKDIPSVGQEQKMVSGAYNMDVWIEEQEKEYWDEWETYRKMNIPEDEIDYMMGPNPKLRYGVPYDA